MTLRLVACLALVSLACECYPSDQQPYICLPMYPVAPGDHGYFYEGRGELRVVSSADVEMIDSTALMRAELWTVDEESNFQAYEVREPQLYVVVVSYGYGQPDRFGCNWFVSDPPEVIELSLDGSINRFRCFDKPDYDAQLVLRNVGENAIVDPYPRILDSELLGTYTEGGGAEVYEVRLQTFGEELKWLSCGDPGAREAGR